MNEFKTVRVYDEEKILKYLEDGWLIAASFYVPGNDNKLGEFVFVLGRPVENP